MHPAALLGCSIRTLSGKNAEAKQLDSKQLGELVAKLANLDITQLVRRQAAILLHERRDAEVMFQEYFVGLTELRRVLAPGGAILCPMVLTFRPRSPRRAAKRGFGSARPTPRG